MQMKSIEFIVKLIGLDQHYTINSDKDRIL